MQTAAPVGSIAVSENTRRLCEGYFILKPLGATRGQRRQRAGQRLRGDGPRAAAHAVAAFGWARADEVRRARARDGGAQARRRAGQGGARADRRGDGGAGGRQVAAVLRVQGDFAIRLDGAGDLFGLARQGLAPICRCSICCTAISRSRARTIERTRREKVDRRITRILDRSLEDTLPYLFSLLGIVEGDDPLAQMDGQIEEAAHAGGDQADSAARSRSISR